MWKNAYGRDYKKGTRVFNRRINDVKSVIKTDEYYYFKFCFPFDSMYLCQKDLISEGTLEDFERLLTGGSLKNHKDEALFQATGTYEREIMGYIYFK